MKFYCKFCASTNFDEAGTCKDCGGTTSTNYVGLSPQQKAHMPIEVTPPLEAIERGALLATVRKLETLQGLFRTAANRKRKTLPIHTDEFQGYVDALGDALNRLAPIE